MIKLKGYFKIVCGSCRKRIQCRPGQVGLRIPCPHCGAHLRVPEPPPPPPKELSELAVASLALSLGSLLVGPLGFIPGILCGHLAQRRLARNPRLLGEKFARAGLKLGYTFMVLFVLILLYWRFADLIIERWKAGV